MDYQEFLRRKQFSPVACGHQPVTANPMLFDFQRDLFRWSVRKGRAALFCDCGMGKTPMQLAWAHDVHKHTDGNVLILAPLSVAKQTRQEGGKFGVDVQVCERQQDIRPGVNITNYEKLHHFDPAAFSGVVLDESSIIKHHTSKTRDALIEAFQRTPYRLACTATPAPNDYMEIGNHAEFLGIMSRSEMLSMFFIHDGGDTAKWRLKGHGKRKFWEWVCTWAVMLRKPSDLGYPDCSFTLPPINYHHHVIDQDGPQNGYLFAMPASTLAERRAARKDSLEDRCRMAADLVNGSDGPWLVWCDLNAESELLTRMINGAIEVKGADSEQHKEKSLLDFAAGKVRALVSKPSIAGFGMNFQICHKMAFVGLSDSFESYYQAVRRCYRFGQEHPVDVHVITHESEGNVVENIKRKEADALAMAESMVLNMADISSRDVKGSTVEKTEYRAASRIELPRWMEATA
jgi:hypothetical protein